MRSRAGCAATARGRFPADESLVAQGQARPGTARTLAEKACRPVPSKIGCLTCAGGPRRSASLASCRRNTQLGVTERRYVTNISKARELGTGLEQITDVHVRMSLQLQAAFGLRRGSDQVPAQLRGSGDHIALKGSWTKGGRERAVPITTTEQRDALQAAHHLAGTGSLIPANKTYIQQRHVYDGQCKAAGLSHMHGLRHQYAQNRYETLTGRPPPTAGGPLVTELSPTQRIEDRHARQTISREFERVQITAIYLGS